MKRILLVIIGIFISSINSTVQTINYEIHIGEIKIGGFNQNQSYEERSIAPFYSQNGTDITIHLPIEEIDNSEEYPDVKNISVLGNQAYFLPTYLRRSFVHSPKTQDSDTSDENSSGEILSKELNENSNRRLNDDINQKEELPKPVQRRQFYIGDYDSSNWYNLYRQLWNAISQKRKL